MGSDTSYSNQQNVILHPEQFSKILEEATSAEDVEAVFHQAVQGALSFVLSPTPTIRKVTAANAHFRLIETTSPAKPTWNSIWDVYCKASDKALGRLPLAQSATPTFPHLELSIEPDGLAVASAEPSTDNNEYDAIAPAAPSSGPFNGSNTVLSPHLSERLRKHALASSPSNKVSAQAAALEQQNS